MNFGIINMNFGIRSTLLIILKNVHLILNMMVKKLLLKITIQWIITIIYLKIQLN